MLPENPEQLLSIKSLESEKEKWKNLNIVAEYAKNVKRIINTMNEASKDLEIQKLTNQELKNEIERRIKNGEWRIETEYEKTYGDSSVRYTHSFSFLTDKNERRFLEVNALLEEQDEIDREREELEIKKDNSRIKDWEKMKALIDFSIETKGGWGNKNLILNCKKCGLEIDHIYFKWGEWKRINGLEMNKDLESGVISNHQIDNIIFATSLSMIEYEWETHLAQDHECESKSWTEARQNFPKYDEWLRSKNEGLWKARQMNK